MNERAFDFATDRATSKAVGARREWFRHRNAKAAREELRKAQKAISRALREIEKEVGE